MIKISVIIPAYNVDNLIKKCITSLCEQTYPKDFLEIIVVDDGSTDKT
ncbi:MAG: glycosyltransferase, partial [Butyrivibrio sp.]|nr:glycosyltransferase [Butyrivibrio sp.]